MPAIQPKSFKRAFKNAMSKLQEYSNFELIKQEVVFDDSPNIMSLVGIFYDRDNNVTVIVEGWTTSDDYEGKTWVKVVLVQLQAGNTNPVVNECEVLTSRSLYGCIDKNIEIAYRLRFNSSLNTKAAA